MPELQVRQFPGGSDDAEDEYPVRCESTRDAPDALTPAKAVQAPGTTIGAATEGYSVVPEGVAEEGSSTQGADVIWPS